MVRFESNNKQFWILALVSNHIKEEFTDLESRPQKLPYIMCPIYEILLDSITKVFQTHLVEK